MKSVRFRSIKISQEVREFAAKQNSAPDSFLAADEADEGMKEMAERYRDGGDLYMKMVE